MPSSHIWALAIIGYVLCVFLAVFILLNDYRIDDLEARMTTFETVRIEYVAPADDSG